MLIKFSKSLKDLRKILLKWLGKTVKYWLNFYNFFVHAMKNGWKLSKRFPEQKFTVLNEVFFSPKLSFSTKFHLILSRLWLKSIASHKYRSYLIITQDSFTKICFDYRPFFVPICIFFSLISRNVERVAFKKKTK